MSGCGGSGVCQCGGQAQQPVPAINGIGLHAPGERPDLDLLSERAWGELLRQEAVRRGLLPRLPVLTAPALSDNDRQVIQTMLEEAVPLREPGEEECRRYYEANKGRFVDGRKVHLRHILFAVTPGVDVVALRRCAEAIFLDVRCQEAASGDAFGAAARKWSNCPSGAQGGELGWFTFADCASEFAREIFGRAEIGVLARLVHSRFGLHVVAIDAREPGRLPAFEQVRDAVAQRMRQLHEISALRQYLQTLAADARLEGVEMQQASSPLVQ